MGVGFLGAGLFLPRLFPAHTRQLIRQAGGLYACYRGGVWDSMASDSSTCLSYSIKGTTVIQTAKLVTCAKSSGCEDALVGGSDC